MINRANLARTSGKPGKTRTINFYIINDSFRFVDLPGYGYAIASKSEKEKWGKIIEKYLTDRKNLKEVILIVDIIKNTMVTRIISHKSGIVITKNCLNFDIPSKSATS